MRPATYSGKDLKTIGFDTYEIDDLSVSGPLLQPLWLPQSATERPLPRVAIGRKNWLHLDSKEAGPKIAAIFSIVESCRKLNIPIRQFLLDVLPGLADRAIHSLAEFTPAAYAAKIAK